MKVDVRGLWERTRRFFREVRSEMRKVMFPGRRELGLYTVVVVGSVLFVSALIWVIDSLLSQMLGLVIK